ncbi:hypothetical protein D3C78_1794840 [compost metagenome]
MQDQHDQTAEQQAEQQQQVLVARSLGSRQQADGWAQLVFRDQVQVDVLWLAAVG